MNTSSSYDDKSINDYINHFYDDNPFTSHLGVDIISIKEGNVCVALKIQHEHTKVYGIAHGGVIMSLCDMAMGAACLSLGKKVVTLDFNINVIKSINQADTALVKGKQPVYQNLYNAFENECCCMEMPLCLCGISLGAILALQYTRNNPQKVKSLMLIAPQYKMPRFLLGIQNIMFYIFPRAAFSAMGFSKRDMIALTTSMKKIDFTSLLKLSL